MTKKDYILIAEVLRIARPKLWYTSGESPILFDAMVHHFAIKLQEDNPNFNEKKFVDYIEAV